MLDFKELETFVCVTDLRSFHRAAQFLNTTQPAVSQRIARLELTLGTKLLHRKSRSIVPTPTGQLVLDYAQRLLKMRGELIQTVGATGVFCDRLRIGASETLVHTWLPKLIRQVNANFPRLSLDVEIDISPRLLERLAAFEIDLAFMVDPGSVPAICTRLISRYPVSFVASPSMGLAAKKLSIKELAKWPIVTYSQRTLPFEAVRDAFNQVGRRDICLHASASLSTVTGMAIGGACVAAIPPVVVRPQIERRELEILEVDAELPDLCFVAAWRERRPNAVSLALLHMAVELGNEESISRR